LWHEKIDTVQYDPHPQLPLMIGYALIAPRIKVMYVPTTKVACSTLKLLVAQIEGTYNEQAAREIITPNISQEQTIHNYRVHGLRRMFDLTPKSNGKSFSRQNGFELPRFATH
jgi:hypothetical protein